MQTEATSPVMETELKPKQFINPIDTIWFILQAAKVITAGEIWVLAHRHAV